MTTTMVGTPDDDANLYATYRAMRGERIAAVGRVIRAPLAQGRLFRAPLTKVARLIQEKKA